MNHYVEFLLYKTVFESLSLVCDKFSSFSECNTYVTDK